MQANLFTLPVYDNRISSDKLVVGVPSKLMVIRPDRGDAADQKIVGSGLYVGRVAGEPMQTERGYASTVWKNSGAVWEDEENAPTKMGKRTVIAGSLIEGSGARKYNLISQKVGDETMFLRLETGFDFPPGTKNPQRMAALNDFMQKYGAVPEPHGAFALAPEVRELSSGEAHESEDSPEPASEAVRLSSAVDGQIAAGGGVSWGRRYLFFVPKNAAVLVKGAVPGVLYRVVNTGGKLEIRKPEKGDLETWYQLEADRVSKARKSN